MASNTVQKAARRQIASTVRLSCEGCTKRKKKCDRLVPCTNCRDSGIICVPVERRRLPRGRTRGTGGFVPGQTGTHNMCVDGVHCSRPRLSPGLTIPAVMSMTPSTMEDLSVSTRRVSQDTSEFLQTLRGIGAPYDGTVWDQSETETVLGNRHISDNNWVGEPSSHAFPNKFSSAECELLNNFRQRQQLLDTYLTRVDPIVKIVHRPSILAYLLHGKCYLDYDPWHPAPTALASAIYYAASCTLSQESCRSSFGIDKETLILKYKEDTNCALERADYLVTDDLTVLQAFVISLVALRCHDHSRRFWTMIAVAIRNAQALALHDPDPPFPIKPFEKEMRRRLWYAIGWLDMQASLSRASEPLLQPSWLGFQPFLDIDDAEFGPDIETQSFPHKVVSETLFFRVLSLAQETGRYLVVSNSNTPYINNASQRQQLVRAFERRMGELFVGLQPAYIDFHWYLKEIAHSIEVSFQLLAFRPLKKAASLQTCPPTGVNILKLAVEVLDSRWRVYGNRKTEPWRWVEPLFFPWQALAIALAEVRGCEDLPLVQSVWPLIEHSYTRFTALDNKSPEPRLRKLMKELMEHARAFYESMLLNGSAFAGLLLPAMPRNQTSYYMSAESCAIESISAQPSSNSSAGVMASQVDDFADWFNECGELNLSFLGL